LTKSSRRPGVAAGGPGRGRPRLRARLLQAAGRDGHPAATARR